MVGVSMTITMNEDKLQLGANVIYAELSRCSSITWEECLQLACHLQDVWQDTEIAAEPAAPTD